MDFEAHCDWHDNLQTRLRRRHGRTFGARHKGKPAETEAQSSAIQEPIVNGGQEYASLSKFMAYDECFLFFRRFSALNIQSILHTQSELAKSEEQLRTVEEPLGNVENLSETEREAIEAERMQLMEEIQKKLESYS